MSQRNPFDPPPNLPNTPETASAMRKPGLAPSLANVSHEKSTPAVVAVPTSASPTAPPVGSQPKPATIPAPPLLEEAPEALLTFEVESVNIARVKAGDVGVASVTLKSVLAEEAPRAGTQQPVVKPELGQRITLRVPGDHVLAGDVGARFALVRA